MHYEGYDVPKNFIGGMNHMRTLKKVLALSLVFAMAFTMMAGAAFKDQDKIDASLTDDIQLLTALGVFQGDENGNFNPTDNVRRSEAAKMIYVLKNNGVDDGAVAFQGVSKYSDVPVGHWAEGYINYCTNLGYMSGWSENGVQKFNPNGNVTGVELMKMLLCMIGYKADVQGYTNNSAWQTNVLVDAATSGLSVEFTPSVYAATPRQWTARLMVNAINAPYVSYNRGELQFGSALDSSKSYGEQYLSLATAEGTLISTNSNKLGTVEKNIDSSLNDSDKVVVKTNEKDSAGQNIEVTALGDANDDLLGQPVKMYYKLGSGTSENKVYAVMAYSKDAKVVNTTVDAVTYEKNSSDKKITVDGLGTKTYPDTKTMNVYMNNVLYKTNAKIAEVKEFLGVNSNLAVTLVADKDGYINTVLIHEMSGYAQINKIDAEKNTLSFKDLSTWAGTKLVDENGTALTFDNTSANKDNFNKYLNVASDVTADSIVKIVANTESGKLVYDITLADKIEGTPTGYTLNSDGNAYASLTLNGETVKKAADSMTLSKYTWGTDKSVASDKTFYTDGKYVVYSEGGTETASVNNLAYITAVGVGSSWGKITYKVKALLSDGTVGEYSVAATYEDGKKTTEASAENGVKGSLLTEGAVMSYSVSDGKITLKTLEDSDTIKFLTGTQVYNHDAKTVTVNSTNSYAIDSNAYFFVKSKVGDDYKYSVVKASELTKSQTGTTSTAYAYKTVNGVNTLLFGTLELTSSLVASDAEYAYVTSGTSINNVDGKYVISMEVVDAKNETLTIKKSFDDKSGADAAAAEWADLRGKVVTYSLNDEGNVADIKVVTASSNANALTAGAWNKLEIKGWNNNIISGKVGTADNLVITVASDVKIHFVDATSNTNYTVLSDGSVDGYASKGVVSAYAYVQEIDKVNTITDIFVEVNGDSIENIW